MERSRPEAAPPERPPARRASALLAAVMVLLIAGVCVRLGFWQLDRLEQRRERNAALRESLALPPLELDADALEAVLRDPERFRFRRVRLRGEYVPEAEVVLRGRSLRGRPGVHLLTPLRVEGTRWAVLVDRGWTASPDALTVDPLPLQEPGPREVEGLLTLFPPGVEERHPLERRAGERMVVSIQRLDPSFIQGRLAAPLLPGAYVQQLPGAGAPEGVERLPMPEMTEGPHLGYAVQWFSFAAIAVGGLLVLVIRPRRGSR
jgi:surfeit locus 1 family protein